MAPQTTFHTSLLKASLPVAFYFATVCTCCNVWMCVCKSSWLPHRLLLWPLYQTGTLHMSLCNDTLFTQACSTSVATLQRLFPREYPIRRDGVKNRGWRGDDETPGNSLLPFFFLRVSLCSRNRILFMRAHAGLLRFGNNMVRKTKLSRQTSLQWDSLMSEFERRTDCLI